MQQRAASRIGQTIHDDFATWQSRSLTSWDVLCLFVDGMYLKLSPELKKNQPVLIAHGILAYRSKARLRVILVTGRARRDACGS